MSIAAFDAVKPSSRIIVNKFLCILVSINPQMTSCHTVAKHSGD